jgi:hypothetical protein
MIPKRRIPPRPEPAPKADDAPAISHRAVDYDFALSNGAVLPFTITDDDGRLDESEDRYVFENNVEHVEILKSAVLYVRRIERMYYTDAPAIMPPDHR